MAKIKIKKPQVLEAIKATGGKITGICEMLGITRPTLYRYIESDTDIAEALEFAHIRLIDRAEYKLMEAVEKGEAWAVQLALKDSKRGKERGYGNSVDVTSGNKPLEVKDNNAGFDRAISTLADAIREIVPTKGNGQNSEVDTPK